jgi:glycosyltransferase involved in cell wall biosynthesis
VLSQSVDLEIIVIDDSPEGSARAAVDRYRDVPLRYVRNAKPSRGRPAIVRNVGWPLATGRFVHFLDDDDRAAHGFYRSAIETFDAHPGIGVVVGGIEPFGTESAAMQHEMAYFAVALRRLRRAAQVGSRYWMTASLLFRETMLVNSACMIRLECISPLVGYDSDLPLNEDVDFYCRAIRRFGFRALDRTVVHYRISPDSLMHGREDDTPLTETYRRMHRRYRAAHGLPEMLALKLLARTIMRSL